MSKVVGEFRRRKNSARCEAASARVAGLRVVLRVVLAVPLGLGVAALGGCAGDFNPIRDVAVGSGIGAKPPDAPDFVARSRRESVNYVPIGAVPPARAVPAKTKAEIDAMEADLQRTRGSLAGEAEAARRLATSPPPTPVKAPPPVDLGPPPEPVDTN